MKCYLCNDTLRIPLRKGIKYRPDIAREGYKRCICYESRWIITQKDIDVARKERRSSKGRVKWAEVEIRNNYYKNEKRVEKLKSSRKN